ncbi:MAG: acyl-CoA dehydrogenase family protein [Betaproteobacteria bacterium]
MDFSPSERAQHWLAKADAFFQRYVLPYNPAWHHSVTQGVYPPPFLQDLKALAQEEGLWNLFLPSLLPGEPGTRLSNVDYAPIAELLGRLPWASEVFNCSAPDTGNMELLHLFANPAQKQRWLEPLLAGTMRSAFAMSEPDVASSDPTNLQTSLTPQGEGWVLNGRKWFITGAAHPNCRLLIVVCRNGAAAPGQADSPDDTHLQHSVVLVPTDTPGVSLVRNIAMLNHLAPEGHCEIVFKNVHVGKEQLLGLWGHGFAMAQARLGPGRVHHCMRTIGQCELALELACERVLERQAFGKHLADFSNVQDWIADARIDLDLARLRVMQVAWRLDQADSDSQQRKTDIAAIKVVAARLQSRVVDRAMQIFGAMGLSPDTPLAYFWSWGRAMHLMDGPDEVHLRTVTRSELKKARARSGQSGHYFTTPEQMRAPPRIT